MITGIVAIDSNQGIGLKGQMPWPHLSGDMRWFKRQTVNNVIIMGSTTWKSLGCKPLPNRINVVLSKTHNWSSNGGADHTFSDPDTALIFCEQEYPDKEIFIIGGSEIYNLYIKVTDRFFITEINKNYNCDKFFNFHYVLKQFTNVHRHATFTDPITYTITEYKK